MIACPFCGSTNLEGADICDDCQHSLTDLSIPRPSSPVEIGLLKDQIEVLAPKSPLTVPLDMPVGEVLQKMVAKSIGCVIIVEGKELLGIFSERDALMRLNAEVADFLDQPIQTVMTPHPITLQSKDKIAFALHKMHVGGYRHVPILTGSDLVGVISIRDILNYLTQRIDVPA